MEFDIENVNKNNGAVKVTSHRILLKHSRDGSSFSWGHLLTTTVRPMVYHLILFLLVIYLVLEGLFNFVPP